MSARIVERFWLRDDGFWCADADDDSRHADTPDYDTRCAPCWLGHAHTLAVHLRNLAQFQPTLSDAVCRGRRVDRSIPWPVTAQDLRAAYRTLYALGIRHNMEGEASWRRDVADLLAPPTPRAFPVAR